MATRPFVVFLCCSLLLCCRPVAGAGAGNAASAAGQAGSAANTRYQSTAPHEEREKPPADGVTPDWRFPTIHHAKLQNGLELRVVERRALPLVELRLVLRSGKASDDKPGVAVLTGEMLKVGGTGQLTSRQLLDRVESLGASLAITTARDATYISLSVTRQHLQTALGILADVLQKPRFLPDEYRKLKRREMDRADSLAHSDPAWAASLVLYRELYELPTGVHPYATAAATSKQIEQVMLPDCKAWYGQHVTPGNAFLVVVGDVASSEVEPLVNTAFAKWTGAAPPALSYFRPLLGDKLELYLVDRPGSTQAELFVASLGPERRSSDWAPTKVANQVLGGGVAGRLFLDVREKRSLAYRSFSVLESVANGPSPMMLRAGTQTAKAGLALQALLEHVKLMATAPANAEEITTATRYLSDVFLLQVETAASIADMTAELGVLGLPDDHYDEQRREVAQVSAAQAHQSASKVFAVGRGLIVVSGDAQILATPLSRFADVHVVDTKKGFATSRVVPHNPNAPLELERID